MLLMQVNVIWVLDGKRACNKTCYWTNRRERGRGCESMVAAANSTEDAARIQIICLFPFLRYEEKFLFLLPPIVLVSLSNSDTLFLPFIPSSLRPIIEVSRDINWVPRKQGSDG